MSPFARTLTIVIIIIAAVAFGAYWSLTQRSQTGITSFEECAAAGYPIMESYPRQCAAGGRTFTEKISTSTPAEGLPPVATSSTNIRVSAPVPYQDIGVPVVIQGEARVFENAFSWRVRDADGSVLVEGHSMADAPDIGQFGPFTVVASYPEPKGQTGKVEVFAYSAKDGSEIDTVSIPVNFRNVETMMVKAYFSNDKEDPSALDCHVTYPVERRIPKTAAPARAALEELLRGPTTTEAEQGSRTHINSGVKVQSLSISGGTAYVDFNETLSAGVAGSCRVAAIGSQIEETLKQFPTVQRVIISVNGSTQGVLEP